MATMTVKPTLDIKVKLEINESEARALEALTGYGTDSFVEFFYKHMGKHYMQPHEDGLRSFFKAVQDTIPGILARTDKAREEFTK